MLASVAYEQCQNLRLDIRQHSYFRLIDRHLAVIDRARRLADDFVRQVLVILTWDMKTRIELMRTWIISPSYFLPIPNVSFRIRVSQG